MSKLNEYDAEVRRLYLDEKMSDAEVAAALPIEVSAQTVARYRAVNGIKGHKRGAKSVLDQYEDDIRRMYVDEGSTDEAVAAALPVPISADSVRQKRLRMGIETTRNKKSGRFVREAQYEQVKDELPAAWERSKRMHTRQQRMVGSAARVGEEFGVSPATANKWLRRLGLVEPRSGYDESLSVRAVELFESGLSVPAVSKEIGVPNDTVNAWLNKAGYDLSAEHYTTRMSPEEHRAWRDSIRVARAPAEITVGKFNYKGTPMDSTYEVRFAMHCDQVGLSWKRYDRSAPGALVSYVNGDEEGLYAPDFIVAAVLPVETKGYYTPKDQAKIHAWREQKGELALVTHTELVDFERVIDTSEAMSFLSACTYSDPDPKPDVRGLS